MARAPSEEPEGLVYKAELISLDEEAALLHELEALRFDPIVLHGQAARGTARHYGLGYDYESRPPPPRAGLRNDYEPRPPERGEPIPDWLLPLRARAAELAGAQPDELVEAL